jgi:hypothetical protein
MRRQFTLQEKQELSNNKHIIKVWSSNVEFSVEFKETGVYEHYELGKICKQIFFEADIPDWLTVGDYAKDNIKRWRKQLASKEQPKRGRSLQKHLPASEMGFSELQARIAYLEAENEFLKKLEALETQAKLRVTK